MKTIKEIKEWLLKNAVNAYGTLDLSELDLSDFEGNVKLSSMKVKGDLFQGNQKVKGDLIQNSQEVKGILYQDKMINGKTKKQALEEVEKIYENN